MPSAFLRLIGIFRHRWFILIHSAHAGVSELYFFRLIKVVLWSFFGVRKKSGHDSDFKSIKPLHLIIVLHVVLIALVILLFVIAKVVIPTK